LNISNVGSTASSTCVWYTVNANNSSGVSVGSISAGQTYTYQASGCTWSDDVLHHSDPNGNQYFEGTCDIFVGRQVGGAGLICPSLVRVSLVGEVGGDCIQLGTNGTFVAPTSGTLTLYYNDSSFTDNEGAFTACVTPTSMTDTYDVVVTSGCNFETSVPVTLAISTPTATVSGSATICSGQSTMIQAALTGTAPWNLTWSDGFTQSNIMVSPAVRLINPISTITYTVTNLADAYCTNSASGSATITITSGGTVATPTFNPEGRQYLTPISVTVSCATAGASIHYTTNGLMPSLDDPSIGSGSSVTLSQTAILQARAFTNGYCASAIKAGLYQIGPMVVAGEYDSFFVQTNGVVWGWGDNTFAEITTNNYLYPGQYTEDSALSSVIPLGPVVTLSNVFALSAGGVHTLAVNTNGMVWSWGCGYAGNGNFEYYGPGVAGYNLVGPGGGENVGPLALIANLSNVVSVAASLVNLTTGTGAKFFDFSLVLKTNGTVWAWGDNSYGELGVGNSYVTEDVDYYEDGGFYPVESLTPTQTVGLSGVVAIAAGGDVGMALRSDGTVWVWGDYTDAFYNAYNALESYIPYESLDSSESTGTPMQVTGLSNIVAIALGYQHGMALDQNGFVWTWGWDSQGQLGTGDSYVNNSHGWAPMQIPGLTNVISIAAGDYHSVAVTSSGQVYTWGVNTNFNLTRQSLTGQLGTGTASNHVSTPQLVSGLSSIQSVSAGDAHTLALGTYRGVYLVWGWGDNTSLQLGSGTLGSQPTPVLVQLPIDTDNDGIPDWKKYQLGVDPLNPYQNGDGLLNGVNLAIGFSPVSSDVDASGNSNAFDLTAGYNPFDPSSFPTGDSTNIFPVITLVEPVGAVLIH
jgi:alpha-tubulin suppressor-like RCC1 family protein